MSKKNKFVINIKHIKKLFNLLISFFIISILFNYNLFPTVRGQTGEPSDFTASAFGTNQIDLSWTMGSESDKTYIEYNSYSSWNIGEGTELYNDTGSSISHSGLNAHTLYYYQAWGWNETSEIYSSLYASDNNITLNTPPIFGTPSPVNDSVGIDLSLNWSIYISDYDGDNFNWSIECSNGQSADFAGASNGTKSLSISGLDYSNLYTVWVNATDSYDLVKQWFVFTTKPEPNTPPVFGSPNPANSSTENPLSFTWSIPISDPDGDSFDWSIECTNGQSDSGFVASNDTKSLILTGLSYSTTYMVWVNATDGYDTSHAWYTFSTRDAFDPGAPSGFSASASGRFQINLVWVEGDNSDSTRVEWNTVSDPLWVVGDYSLLYNGSGSSTSQSGLSPGTTLFYKAWSWNSTDSVWSAGVMTSAITNSNNVPVFDTPSPSNGSIGIDLSLTWSIYISDEDGDSFNWDIECSNGQTNSALGASNGTKSLSISGLIYNTMYTVWVNSTDSYNTTRAWSTFFTRGAFEPAVPGSFIATAVSTSQINLRWNIGSNSDKTYIEWNLSSSWTMGQGNLLYNDTGNIISHSNLTARTTYYYQAWSWNSTESLWSVSYSDAHATTSSGGGGGGDGGGGGGQQSNNPPSIFNITHTPEKVTSKDVITISATVTDDTGLFSVKLYWDDGSQHSKEMALQGGNRYSTEIGPFTELETIIYWINATDDVSQITKTTSYYFTIADVSGPLISLITPLSGSTIYDTTPTIRVSFGDPSGINVNSVILNIDDINTSVQNITSSSMTYTPSLNMTYSTHDIKLYVSDIIGNSEMKEWSFTIKKSEFITEESLNNLTSGQEKIFEFENSDNTSIESISVNATINLTDVKISFVKLLEKPEKTDYLPAGSILYCYLQIDISENDSNINYDNFSSFKIKFKIENDWLINQNLNKSSINLLHYQNGIWITQNIENFSGDSYYTYFESSMTAFSTFAIVGNKSTIETSAALEFNYIFVLIAVILIIVLIVSILFKTGILYIEEETSEDLEK